MERKSAAVRTAEAVEAAQHIIGRDGITSVSVRNVAQVAGMSVGSLRHIFPQHEDLMVAILTHCIEAATLRVQAVFQQAEEEAWDSDRIAIALLMEMLPLTPESRTELQAQLAIILANPDNPAVAQVRTKARQGLNQLCARAVELAGVGVEKERRIGLLLDGLALNILEDPRWTRGDAEAALRDGLYGAGHTAG
ncbi:TetR/AcrR family transcriptional regulator [uncultured Corynebacterium sp.]|uniref:TetR/AcrR family transcriptional regulator n=1 Tax=uncultured Corynebacterium sp. TaxID=159447 RepID=UPI002597D696|nr:TetR/AcrR family transcriptional regulator [uncultured Corynebacterium sp.]